MKFLKHAVAFACLAMPVFAADLGPDGLHKPDWLQVTFKDMREDLAEAGTEDKSMVVIFEQRGCIYCTKMHEEVFPQPDISALLNDRFYVVQMNLFGDEEVTDFDGTELPEKEMAKRWGVVFTPTMLFLPEEVGDDAKLSDAAVVTMPGAFTPATTESLLNWVLEKGYESDEHFQKYHARMMEEQGAK